MSDAITPTGKERLFILDNVSSEELMAMELPSCPFCGAALKPTAIRAGLNAFVASVTCTTCLCVFRARDTFSFAPR